MQNPDALFGRLGNRLFQMAYIYAQVKKGEIPDIYVQDYTKFDEFRDDIKKWYGEGIGLLPYVAIHLRVGGNPSLPSEPNYIDNPFYVPLCKTGYYIDAVNQFPNRQFLVFSDDLEFAKTYFEGDKFGFDESIDAVEVLNKMSSCDGHIIANSSLSFWAAYLSPHYGKVIAPTVDKWFSDGVDRVSLPKEWIRL